MAGPIDFYFDFSSPYAYFAASRIEQLAVDNGRLVQWHPVLLGVVFRTVGTAARWPSSILRCPCRKVPACREPRKIASH